jgi:aryl-alcohol dehydrogenase-like predicted oxidoreductase
MEGRGVAVTLPQVELGNSGLKVSRLAFGSLPMGPLQANMTVAQGAAVIRHALERGVTFLDTAASYRNYAHIREALRGFPGRVVIATKTQARTYEHAQEHVRAALTELGLEKLDICLVHGARSADPLAERGDALRCLLECQASGLIGVVGISTHAVRVVRQAAQMPEIQVIHPLINQTGMGILDGTAQDMADAIADADARGKGIYAMKALAGGNLLQQRAQALGYVLALPGVDAVAVGMVNEGEVDYNVALFSGETVTPELESAAPVRSKRLVILQRLCEGCGECVAACPNGAMSLVEQKSRVDADRCILCGYCSPACKQFAIRMV